MSTFRATMMPTSSGLIPRISNLGFTTAYNPTIPSGPLSGTTARTDFRNAPGSFELFGRTKGSSTACPSPPPSYGTRRNAAQALDNSQLQKQLQKHRGSGQGPGPSSMDARQQQQQHVQLALPNQPRPYLQGSGGSEGGQVRALLVHALHPRGRGGGASGGGVSESFPVEAADTGTGESLLISEDGERERMSVRRQRSNLHKMSSANERTALTAGAGAGLQRAGTERRLVRKGTFSGPHTLEESCGSSQQALAAGGEGAKVDLPYGQSPPGSSGPVPRVAEGLPQGVVAAALETTSPESSCERAASGREDSSGSSGLLPVLVPHASPAMGRSQSAAVGAGVVSGLIGGSTGASPLTFSGHLRPIPELATAEVHTGIDVSFGPPGVTAAARPRMLRAVQVHYKQQQQQEAGSLLDPASSTEGASLEPPVIDLFPKAQPLCEHPTLNFDQQQIPAQSPRMSGAPSSTASTPSTTRPSPAQQQMPGAPLRTSQARGNGPSSNVTAKPSRVATHGSVRQGPGRSPTWYAGAPGVHPYPKRILPEGPVELKLCCTPQELLKGVQELKPLRKQQEQEQQQQQQENKHSGAREWEGGAREVEREREWSTSRVESGAAGSGSGGVRRVGARRASVGMLPADVAQRLASGAAPAVAGMVARSGSGSMAGGWERVKEGAGGAATTTAAVGDGGAAASVLRSVTLEGGCRALVLGLGLHWPDDQTQPSGSRVTP